MTFLQEKELREQSQEVKREHDTRFPEGEEHLYFDGDVYAKSMETTSSPQHFQHLQQHFNNNNNRHNKVYRLLDSRRREWNHNLLLKC
jgi:hypothetical protein